jgi:DNA modification methylase
LAAHLVGLTEVPAMVARGWSQAQIAAYRIADNQLALNAGWNPELLRLELGELKGLDFNIGLIGFSTDELQLLTPAEEDDAADIIPPLPTVPVTRRGDLWECGQHRVLCGDCRDADDVARLIGGVSINLAFTSPPYAEQRNYDKASGFHPIRPDDYVGWFNPIAANVGRHLAADGSWFINIKPSAAGLDTELYVMDLVLAHVRQWGWHFASEFCWERNGVPKSVTQRFKNQFEPIYQFARGRWKMRPDAVRHVSENVPRAGGEGVGDTSWANNQGGNGEIFGAAKKRRHGHAGRGGEDIQGTNWQPGEYIGPGLAYPGNRLPTFAGSHEATGHTAAFPVGLPEFFCKAFTDADDVVFDPFLGSGSTLIAATQTKRAGLGCEISPAYVDVAIIRWQNFTGERATLDGRTFDEIAAERRQEAA